MRKTLFGLLVTLFAVGHLAAKPNVVVILADDQGWGDISLNGNSNLRTPNMDKIAKEGARFERFFVCPVCAPTRAEFMTGRYHPRGGVRGVSTGAERLDLDEKTIGDTFKAAGYATGAFGKWHNGMQAPYHPNSRGFDEYYGFCSGHWGNYFDPLLEHNGKFVQGKGYITDDFTEHAMAFIEANKDNPFLCYLPLCTPHSPMQVPDKFYDPFHEKKLAQLHRDPQREDVPKTRAALAMCENIDYNVGRVLKKLDELKLAENTIVLYFSDNGPNSYRWNDGMKGRKGATDEGGVRSALHIRWPGKIEPGTKITQIAGAIDLLPTLTDCASIGEIQGKKPLDGKSLKPLLMGKSPEWSDRMLFSHWNRRVSVRTQQYRLDHMGKLYDMQADPGQRKDVSKENPAVAKRLSGAVAKWRKDLLTGFGKDDRPFTVGYSQETHLPARDGVPHGNVKRSARAPNCSFFTNWTTKDDRITWDVEVGQAGAYQAVLLYTCAKEDVGATIELSFKDARVEKKVTESHDPPLRGKENDRTDRGSESYVKNFAPLDLGTLQLEKGRGLLSLRALEIPGDKVVDVRYLILTRVGDK